MVGLAYVVPAWVALAWVVLAWAVLAWVVLAWVALAWMVLAWVPSELQEAHENWLVLVQTDLAAERACPWVVHLAAAVAAAAVETEAVVDEVPVGACVAHADAKVVAAAVVNAVVAVAVADACEEAAVEAVVAQCKHQVELPFPFWGEGPPVAGHQQHWLHRLHSHPHRCMPWQMRP